MNAINSNLLCRTQAMKISLKKKALFSVVYVVEGDKLKQKK